MNHSLSCVDHRVITFKKNELVHRAESSSSSSTSSYDGINYMILQLYEMTKQCITYDQCCILICVTSSYEIDHVECVFACFRYRSWTNSIVDDKAMANYITWWRLLNWLLITKWGLFWSNRFTYPHSTLWTEVPCWLMSWQSFTSSMLYCQSHDRWIVKLEVMSLTFFKDLIHKTHTECKSDTRIR